MRRVLISLCLLTLAAPLAAQASTWRHFTSKKLGFGLQYPADWQVLSSLAPGSPQTEFLHQRQPVYALTVSVLPIKPASTASATARLVVRYFSQRGDTTLSAVRWAPASLGGHPAVAGILRPPTEGGVAQTEAIYLAPWRSRIYEISMAAYGGHQLSRLDQFPSVYRQMLRTWRYL
jgi:hypothetical protein